MKALIITYYLKIGFTLVGWCLPLLLLPGWVLEQIGTQDDLARYPLMLLGWAYFALCVGYLVGLINAKKGKHIMAPIWAGIFSNGGAAVLLAFITIAEIERLNCLVTGYLLVSAAGATLVTFNLVYFGLLRSR